MYPTTHKYRMVHDSDRFKRKRKRLRNQIIVKSSIAINKLTIDSLEIPVIYSRSRLH